MVPDGKSSGSYMGLDAAVIEIIDRLRGRPASEGDGPDNWKRIVSIIAEHDSLPDSEVKVIEAAIVEAGEQKT